MGKTLKRQRQKQAREQQLQQKQQQQNPAKLPRLADGKPLTAAASSSKFTAAVTAALGKRAWAEALRVLEAMQEFKKVPKLGAVQRWVRDADQAGSEAVTARLLDAILRCTLPPPVAPLAPAAGPLQGSVVRHPPWRPEPPPLPAAPAAAAAACSEAGEQREQAPAQEQTAAAQDAHEQTAAQDAASQPQDQQRQDEQGEQEQQRQRQQPQDAGGQAPTAQQLREALYEVPFEAGAGGPDAIHAFRPHTIRLDPDHPPVRATPVPFVPGAVLLHGVLSPAECRCIMAAAEAIGWHSDVDYTFGGAAGGDGGGTQQQRHQQAAAAGDGAGGGGEARDQQQQQQQERQDQQQADAAAAAAAAAAAGGGGGAASSAARGLAAGLAGLQAGGPAAGCVWLADDALLAALCRRVQHLLPQEVEGGAFGGINARWRLYRYTPGAVYRPHVDGAWPGSGVDAATGRYVFDAYGDRWSRLTFLVYLNEGFEGGCTTYYTPSETQAGVLEARGVVPVQGNVLVFPHGGTKGSLVHEGSAVLQGAKYVIRTDVLYMNPPAAASAGRGGAGGGGRGAVQQQRQRQQQLQM